MKIIAEPTYYELHIKPASENEEGNYFMGAGGIFENRTNLFSSLEEFDDYMRETEFDDSIYYDKTLYE